MSDNDHNFDDDLATLAQTDDDDQDLNKQLDTLPDHLRPQDFLNFQKKVNRDCGGPTEEEDILIVAQSPSQNFEDIRDRHKKNMLMSAKKLNLSGDKSGETTNDRNSNAFDEPASRSGNNKTGSNDRRIVTKQMSSSTSNKSQYNSVKHKTTIISASIMTKAAEEKYFAEKNVITTRSMVKTRNNSSSADQLKSGYMKTHSKSKTSTSTSNSNAGPRSIKSLPSVSQKISNKKGFSFQKI